MVTITNDCTLQVSNFNIDGQAPAVYWWGGPSCDYNDLRTKGYRLSDVEVSGRFVDQSVTVTKTNPTPWDQIGCISVWCQEFDADLAHVAMSDMVRVSSPSPQPVPQPSPSPQVPTPVTPSPQTPSPIGPTPGPQENCVQLLDGYFNMNWSLEGSAVTLKYEARLGPGDKWLGFGYSPPGSQGVTMVGANTTLVGIVGEECFAYNFYLESRSQCDFASQTGVCPQTTDNPVKLLSCQRSGEILSIEIERPVGDWPLDTSRYSIWAMGPLSEGSTVDRPIVLYHSMTLPGMTGDAVMTRALPGSDFSVSLASPLDTCTPLILDNKSPSAAPPIPPPAVLSGITVFNVTTGTNANYPNPPAWGLSYHVNGYETPVLEVERGMEYTFNVMAGPTHPLYITTSILGGGSFTNYTGETVFAGNDTTHGTVEDPYVLKWTPDASTPDLVYYQCAVHQKLGWEIQVGNPAPTPSPVPSPPSHSSSVSSLTVGLFVTSMFAIFYR